MSAYFIMTHFVLIETSFCLLVFFHVRSAFAFFRFLTLSKQYVSFFQDHKALELIVSCICWLKCLV